MVVSNISRWGSLSSSINVRPKILAERSEIGILLVTLVHAEPLPREHGGEAPGQQAWSYFGVGGATTSCSFGFSRIRLNSSSL